MIDSNAAALLCIKVPSICAKTTYCAQVPAFGLIAVLIAQQAWRPQTHVATPQSLCQKSL